jgi:hypothetical protein
MTLPGSSMGVLEPDSLVSRVRLGDIGWLFFGSTLAELLTIAFVSLAHGSRFISVVVALIVGNIWYLARYEWLSPRRGWADLRQRFAPIDHRVLMGCVAGGAALVFGFVGLKELLEWSGIKLADQPSPLFAPSHLTRLPAAVIAIAIIGPMAEELLFRGVAAGLVEAQDAHVGRRGDSQRTFLTSSWHCHQERACRLASMRLPSADGHHRRGIDREVSIASPIVCLSCDHQFDRCCRYRLGEPWIDCRSRRAGDSDRGRPLHCGHCAGDLAAAAGNPAQSARYHLPCGVHGARHHLCRACDP